MELGIFNEDDDFEKLLEEKRHKELLTVLKSASETEDEFQKLLEDKRHKEMIGVLKEVLISLSKETIPLNFDVSGIIKEIAQVKNELPSSIINLGKLIEKKLDELKSTPQENNYNWEFIVQRDNKGFIEKVLANKIGENNN